MLVRLRRLRLHKSLLFLGIIARRGRCFRSGVENHHRIRADDALQTVSPIGLDVSDDRGTGGGLERDGPLFQGFAFIGHFSRDISIFPFRL